MIYHQNPYVSPPSTLRTVGGIFRAATSNQYRTLPFLCCPTMSFMAENPKRALLVIDVQNEYFTGKLPITYPAGSLANVLSAMDAAREHGVPVVVIQHASPQPDAPVFRKGSKEWELHPEVATRSHDVLIHKSLPGSFTGTELETWLRDRGLETVVIAGYMTQMCCDTTARQAMHLGFGALESLLHLVNSAVASSFLPTCWRARANRKLAGCDWGLRRVAFSNKGRASRGLPK